MRLPPAKGSAIELAASLEEQILACDDHGKLFDLLDMQARTAAPSRRLDEHLRKYIDRPVRYLTSKVLRVYRFSGSHDPEVQEAAASYLTLEAYNGAWCDESIVSIGWANEHLSDGLTSPLTVAYQELLQEAELAGDADLLEFCDGYRIVKELREPKIKRR